MLLQWEKECRAGHAIHFEISTALKKRLFLSRCKVGRKSVPWLFCPIIEGEKVPRLRNTCIRQILVQGSSA